MVSSGMKLPWPLNDGSSACRGHEGKLGGVLVRGVLKMLTMLRVKVSDQFTAALSDTGTPIQSAPIPVYMTSRHAGS